jgi:signal transduction histidine kinase
LTSGNIRLQRSCGPVDQINAMTTVIQRADGGEGCDNPRPDTDLSTRELAHELNSLLDGSLRSLRLAHRALCDTPPDQPELLAEALSRLEAAQRALREMAEVLERAMNGRRAAVALAGTHSIGEVAQLAEAAVSPMCIEGGVSLRIDIAPDAVAIPAGPLAFVLINALRNAVQACASAGQAEAAVHASVELSDDRAALILTVTDRGSGLHGSQSSGDERLGGHGIGLEVSRRIVADLDGSLTLEDNDAGPGTTLRVQTPIRSLARQ